MTLWNAVRRKAVRVDLDRTVTQLSRRQQCVHDGRTWLRQLLLCTQAASENSLVGFPINLLQEVLGVALCCPHVKRLFCVLLLSIGHCAKR